MGSVPMWCCLPGLSRREQAQLWRASAHGARANGDRAAYERYARTAALIEGRPWKVDRTS